MNSLKKENLKRLLSPKNIAFFGGNDVEVAIAEAKRRGFKGPIWPVNPNRKSILGIKCFKSIHELPTSPDASFIAVPSKYVSFIINNLVKKGAGGAVCYSAGFGETGPEGKLLESELSSIAKDMPIIGPNCYGFINYLDNVALWPFAHGGISPGYGAAIITQSGMLSSDITMTDRSIPLTHMISVGNQASVSIEDLIDILCENPKVKAIGVHIEGIKNVRKLHDVALKALKKNVPIVALKTGTSAVGEKLTTTHTGSLSGEDSLYDALFERVGIIRVKSPILFLELLKLICVSGIPKDNKLVAFTCSGGGATMIADYAEKIGVLLPTYSTTGKKALKNLLPEIATVSNPLDYTTPIWGNEKKTAPVFSTAMREAQASTGLLLQDYPAKGLDESEISYINDAYAFIKSVNALNMSGVICSTFPENMKKSIRDDFMAKKITPMLGIEDTLESIKLASDYKVRQKRTAQISVEPLLKVPEQINLEFLNEFESKSALSEVGISVPRGQIISSKNIEKTAVTLQFPIALKLLNSKIIHKTEYGAVLTNIKSRDELIHAAKQMYDSLKKTYKSNIKDQFLIEEMVSPPIVEMIIGVEPKPEFGYSLLIGAGGVQTEIINDTESILLPTNKNEIIRSIEKLNLYRLMNNFRSKKRVRLDRLASDIMKIISLLNKRNQNFSSVEINPLFVYETSTCAVDAVVSSSSEFN